MSYIIDGLSSPVAIVGDAIFAGSMGGGMVSFADALNTNREKLMTLSEETIICPGHGPMSTIAEEKLYNPFFPEF
jgi:glyoxylase-like metal-dependent hydrolase (beta-lactamase superfamily II)